MSQLETLRQKYPVFTYHSYRWQLHATTLHLEYDYSISPEHIFTHRLAIGNISENDLSSTSSETLKTMIFSLGLSEMLSYWKTTCSPHICIEAGELDSDQLAWWHDLLIHGMGEFFYVNDIDFSIPNFVTITTKREVLETRPLVNSIHFNIPVSKCSSILVPIGGGKDSILTIELLKQIPELELTTFLINPTTAAKDTSIESNISKSIVIDRKIDPLVYDLNDKGYLNGHVPISASIAFTAILVSYIKGINAIAISNERSSNEGNVVFHGETINHQYSKSFEFEQNFQNYVKKYLYNQQSNNEPHYFSYLRPLYELQIARLFADLTQYHALFRSCNRGQKTNTWCGNCPKCLFAYLILYPFLTHDQMVAIFGYDLFTNTQLEQTALALVNCTDVKPLECVGVYEESLLAFYLSMQKITKENRPVPYLVELVNEQLLQNEPNLSARVSQLMTAWNDEHTIPLTLLTPLKMGLSTLKQEYEHTT